MCWHFQQNRRHWKQILSWHRSHSKIPMPEEHLRHPSPWWNWNPPCYSSSSPAKRWFNFWNYLFCLDIWRTRLKNLAVYWVLDSSSSSILKSKLAFSALICNNFYFKLLMQSCPPPNIYKWHFGHSFDTFKHDCSCKRVSSRLPLKPHSPEHWVTI